MPVTMEKAAEKTLPRSNTGGRPARAITALALVGGLMVGFGGNVVVPLVDPPVTQVQDCSWLLRALGLC